MKNERIYMATVDYAEQVLAFCNQIQEIQSATNLDEVSSTIEKTQRAILEILKTKTGTRNFDDAIQNQFILLDLLREMMRSI
jgi:predicted RNA-binding protein with PIN domain